ncbi:unnamed protein product [Leptidea sinapis]|uniref:Organic solute transporter alpha-like protein n=1 Tax=Leptidea sinapis TaxID=189913 RepID=A0A5E4QCW7_9NEOP|nr:unnamed protein product [Leptidea sinapis]
MDLLASESSSSSRILTARHVSAEIRHPEVNNAVNTTSALLCHSYSVLPDFGSYYTALNTYALVTWICGFFVLAALCILYGVTLRSALKHWPKTKVNLAVVLAVYPIVAAAGLLTLIVPRARILSEAIAQETVMVAMYHLYFMIIAECGGPDQLISRSSGSLMETRVLPCCCWPCCLLPRPQVQKKCLTRLRYLILQMPIVQALIYIIVLVLWAEDVELYRNNFILIQPFIAVSILSGIWGMMICIRAAEAIGTRPRARFLALQLVLLIVKLQYGIAKALPELFQFSCIVALNPSVFVHMIQNMIMMAEMLLLSLWAWRLYSVQPEKSTEKVPQVVIAVLEDSLHSIDLKKDIEKSYKNERI